MTAPPPDVRPFPCATAAARLAPESKGSRMVDRMLASGEFTSDKAYADHVGARLPFQVLKQRDLACCEGDYPVRAVYALANTDSGGVAFIGVSPANRAYESSQTPPKPVARLRQLLETALPEPRPRFAVWSVHGGIALVVESAIAHGNLCLSRHPGAPIYVASENSIKVDESKRRSDLALDLGLTTNESCITGFRADVAVEPALDDALEHDGTIAKVTHSSGAGHAYLTVAGLHVLGTPAARHAYPGLCVDVEHYAAAFRDAESGGIQPYRTDRWTDSPMTMLQAGDELAAAWNRDFAPPETLALVVRELLLNALTHMVLPSEPGGAIGVRLRAYPDAISVVSNGSVPKWARSEDGSAIDRRWNRNPLVASLLGSLGGGEPAGSGLGGLREALRGTELMLALSSVDQATIATLLLREEIPLRSVNRSHPLPPVAPRAGVQDPASSIAAAESAPSDVAEPRRNTALGDSIISALEHGPMSASRLATELERPGSTVRTGLRALVEEGVVCRTRASARSPGQEYVLRVPST